MQVGALVMRKNMWGISSKEIGIVLGPVQCDGSRGGVWKVLWSSKRAFEVGEHYGDSLFDLSIEDPTGDDEEWQST